MTKTISTNWTLRLQRAARLLEEQSASGELLSFYVEILRLQARIAAGASSSERQMSSDLPFRAQLDVSPAVSQFDSLVEIAVGHGPAPLSAALQELRNRGAEYVREFLELAAQQSNSTSPDLSSRSTERFVSLSLLQPIAEVFACQYLGRTMNTKSCPLCDALPQVAILRPEGDGAKRSLQCSFCLGEWSYPRVLCPWCQESDNDKLPRFSAADCPHVRVEACDTCRRYLKSIDLTVDGRAIPMVDEIAMAALDLWAAEQGYQKITPNLLGF